MIDLERVPAFIDCRPIEGEDGWYSWNVGDETRFNGAVLGHVQVRVEGDRVRTRMQTERRHSNLQDNIHGGVTLSLIDISLFSAMNLLGSQDGGRAVTLELSNQFVGGGIVGKPLDALTQVVRETGRLMFLRGDVVQAVEGGEHTVAAFSGIIRK
ncbi:MAG: PaaI family thioesterase [Alteripontixanthobacter sp.]